MPTEHSRLVLSSTLVAIISCSIQFLGTNTANAYDDSLIPEIKCGSPMPTGVRKFNFNTHVEVVGEVIDGIAPFSGVDSGTLRERYAVIRNSSCWIRYYTFSLRKNEERLPSTGPFSDLFTDPLAPSKTLLDSVANSAEIVSAYSPDLVECRGQSHDQSAAGVTETEACFNDALRMLNKRGFIGTWVSDSGNIGNYFVVIDGEFSVGINQ